jgi:hypothetical protein
MPDSRSHRGAHPEDLADFAVPMLPRLRSGVAELSYLYERGYSQDASLKLVGDHHQLRLRQRQAVSRAACSDRALARRRAQTSQLDQLSARDEALWLDGFNCLITVEALLSRAPVFRGRDGALRDLASVHGTYRAVSESERAARLLLGQLTHAGLREVRLLLDRPVGNSGRTAALFARVAEELGIGLVVSLSDQVDRELAESGAVVASSDSWLLDHSRAWLDLPSLILAELPESWLVDLSPAT